MASSLTIKCVVLLALLVHLSASAYVRRDLVANRVGLFAANATTQPPATIRTNLVNPWGLAFGSSTPAWIASEATSMLAIISGTGSVSQLSVAVGNDTPTGLVFNPRSDQFLIPSSASSSQSSASSSSSPSAQSSAAPSSPTGTASQFITATEQGDIWAWGSTLRNVSAAVRVASSASSVFKGLALAANGTAPFLAAADFANRRLVIFDAQFRRVNLTSASAFVDPDVPADFAPFNVANILGDIWVAYARQNASSPGDEVVGAGLGFVSVFDPTGRLVRRFASGGALNAPWGMVLAPLSFGEFGGNVLVGNFGDGRLWAYDLATGNRTGQIRTSDNREFALPGLWGLAFGNGALGQPTNTLFFAAGVNDETDGVFGRIDSLVVGTTNATTSA